MPNGSQKKFNGTTQARVRRSNVISRLESQLKSGTKNTKEGVQPLEEKDVKRIERELETLKSRI